MASVINSARNSTSSIFELVETLATTSGKLVITAARAVDALDAKARLMHASVVLDTKAQLVIVEDEAVTRAATQHTDMMEEAHKRNFPDEAFDRKAFYLAAIVKIREAVAK